MTHHEAIEHLSSCIRNGVCSFGEALAIYRKRFNLNHATPAQFHIAANATRQWDEVFNREKANALTHTATCGTLRD